jgi:hypothetical protein
VCACLVTETYNECVAVLTNIMIIFTRQEDSYQLAFWNHVGIGDESFLFLTK